jgi:hypothetical protein
MGSTRLPGKDTTIMVPRAVQDAGYTAVGLGVMAAQQVQVRRRETRARLEAEARDARRRAESILGEVKTRVGPVAGEVVDRLPQLPLPGPLGRAVTEGRARLRQALR